MIAGLPSSLCCWEHGCLPQQSTLHRATPFQVAERQRTDSSILYEGREREREPFKCGLLRVVLNNILQPKVYWLGLSWSGGRFGFAVEVCGYRFCLFFQFHWAQGDFASLHAWREPIAEHCAGVTNRPCVSQLSVTSTCLHLTLKKCKATFSFLKAFRSVLIDTMQ